MSDREPRSLRTFEKALRLLLEASFAMPLRNRSISKIDVGKCRIECHSFTPSDARRSFKWHQQKNHDGRVFFSRRSKRHSIFSPQFMLRFLPAAVKDGGSFEFLAESTTLTSCIFAKHKKKKSFKERVVLVVQSSAPVLHSSSLFNNTPINTCGFV